MNDDETDTVSDETPDTTMTDETSTDARPTTEPDASTADPDASAAAPDEPTADSDGSTPDSKFAVLTEEDFRAVLDRVALGLLALLALIAGWSFYSYTGTAIELWVGDAYQPLALAAFNLAVLLVALAGITHQLGRIRSEGRPLSAE